MALQIEIKRGATRWVLLIGNYALKFPRIHVKREHLSRVWKTFLLGMIANMTENEFGRCGFDILCPVVFRIPGGFLTVMPRATPLTVKEWKRFDYEDFFHNAMLSTDLAENKRDSFGIVNGKIVAIDYGN